MITEHGRRSVPVACRAMGRRACVAAAVLTLMVLMAGRAAQPTRTAVPGFDEVAFTIAPVGDGQFCALLAADERQRSRGLMGRRDLAGYDAMLFRFPSPRPQAMAAARARQLAGDDGAFAFAGVGSY